MLGLKARVLSSPSHRSLLPDVLPIHADFYVPGNTILLGYQPALQMGFMLPGVVGSGGCVVSVVSLPFEHELASMIKMANNKKIKFFIRYRLMYLYLPFYSRS